MNARVQRRRRCSAAVYVALVSGLVALSCAAPAPGLRQPGSIAAARFRPGETTRRFRVLAQLTRGLEAAPTVAVAEDAGGLADLWNGYELPGPPPPLDFQHELAFFFTERGFCNDGVLEGFGLTSAGELIPVVRHSEMVCELISYGDCPEVRVYAAALDRKAFPPGPYSLRWPAPVPFVVRSPARDLPGASPAIPATIVARPEGDPAVAGSPRRARIVYPGRASEAGVWVRTDAVWIPNLPVVRMVAPPEPELICGGGACVRFVARVGCWAPECPAEGLLLFGERPIGPPEPWPTDAASWEQLVNELARDPALGNALKPPARFPPPPQPEHGPTVGWAAPRFNRSAELSASADSRRPFGGGSALFGPTLRIGLRRNEAVQDTTARGKLLEPLLGDSWGVDLRLGVLRPLSDTGSSPRTAWRIGVGLAAANAVGPSTSKSRVRVQSVLGLLVPEVGLVHASGEPLRLSLANAFPVSVLLSAHLALEFRPELALMFGSGRREEALSFSVGLMWRTRRALCPNPRPPSDGDVARMEGARSGC